MNKSLELAIPDLVKPDKDAFDIRPRHIEQWLDDLPKANIGETARRLFEALRETNRYRYSAQDRLNFLESIREPVIYVTTAMKRHFVGINHPLPQKSRQIAHINREIFMALATGYKIAIDDSLKQSFLFSDNKTLATMLHRAMTCLARVLLSSYQTYTRYPEGTWQEIHKLYALTEKRKLLHLTVSDDQLRYLSKSSINSEYVRLLLLALTSPYRLRHGEVGKVYETLERWSQKCQLQLLNKHSDSSTLFGVNLDSDEAPRSIQLSNMECDPELCRILDTAELTNRIRKEFKEGMKLGDTTLTGLEMQRPDLSHDLLRRLLIAWCMVSKRGFPRSAKQEEVAVTLGLTATHQIIITGSRGTNDKAAFTNTAEFKSSAIKKKVTGQPDVWDMAYFTSDAIDSDGLIEYDETNPTTVTSQPHYHSEAWAILNESARGYCLKATPDAKEARAQVGELIGIRRLTSGHTWKWGIGVIRWLTTDKGGEVTLGVEMLTPDAAAIGIRALDSVDDYQRTLMLPELRAVNQPTTLITGPVPFREGQHLVINILGKEIEVKLGRQLQNTGLFAQFEFEILEKQENIKPTDEKGDEPDFEGVWSSI